MAFYAPPFNAISVDWSVLKAIVNFDNVFLTMRTQKLAIFHFGVLQMVKYFNINAFA